jgi:hypothetical protein
MRLSSRPGGFSLVAGLAAASALAAGCGEQERQRRIPGTPEAEHAAEVARNPYAVTCGDLARQPQHPAAEHLVIQAEFALAREPVLTKSSRSRR